MFEWMFSNEQICKAMFEELKKANKNTIFLLKLQNVL